MCKRLNIFLYCVVLLCNGKAAAQQKADYIFRHINQSDGLLHTVVNSIVQDSKGFIWILTPNGLQRYDGSRFVNYPYDVSMANFIKNSSDANLFADKKNNCLWIMSSEIAKLDLQKNKFIQYPVEKIMTDSSFTFNSYKDPAGTATLVGDFGIYQHDKASNKLLPLYTSASFLASGKSNLFIVDKTNEESWMSSWPGLTLFSKKTNSIYTHEYNPIGHPLLQLMDKKELRGMLIDSKENYWISTGSPFFYRYNAVSKKMFTYSLPGITTATKINQEKGVLMVNCFFEDNHHNIWIGTSNGGLLQYNSGNDSFISIINDENNKQGLHYNYEIYCIVQDKEENIWLGTDKGISIFSPYRQYFQSIHHEENNPSSIPKNEIMNFIQTANGDIIAGTWGGGITVYDSKWDFKKNISFTNPYQYNMVWSFVQNDDGNIWAGCQHGFIHIYNPVSGTIKTIRPPELNNSTIWCMTKDRKGNIWLGLHDGKIAGWNKEQNKFYRYNDSARGITQEFAHVSNIFFDSRQQCWVSTMSGLKQFDTERRLYSAVYVPDKNNPFAISANITDGIEEYNDSTLLIGTRYGGLNFFNLRNKTFSHLTAKDGLPANTIHAIKKDAAGYVWFTTDYAIYKFKPADKKFIRLNIDPGSINSEFKTASFYPLQDGQWLTATVAEMICFYTRNNFSQKNRNAKVEITGFKVFNNDVSIDSFLETNKPVRLSYGQNFLSFEFALLGFSNQQQTNYYYRLNPVDKDWVHGGTTRFANYTDLQPGEYNFEVKAEQGDNMGETTSFKIIITPPIYKTAWFKILVALIITGLLYALAKWRINTISKEARTKTLFNKQMAEMEMKALRSQMNPHFTFNCINSIDAFIHSNDKYNATLYLNKFAKLLRNILDSSKQNTVLFSKDVDTLKLYIELEELRHENKFKTFFKIDNELLSSDYKVPPLIVQPFVENAILHGLKNKDDNEGMLTIIIEKVNDKIQYVITDNGIGRAAAEKIMQNKESHYGMQMGYDRIKLFNKEEKASVTVKDLYHNENAAGTEVTVKLNII